MYFIFIFSVVAFLAAITVYFFIIVPAKVGKYKEIARQLNAEYVKTKHANAKLNGTINGRNYSVETLLETAGKAAHRWTEISVACVNEGIPLEVRKAFFNNFPNWKGVFTQGDKTECVFGLNINLKNVVKPLDNKDKNNVLQIFQEIQHIYNQQLLNGTIEINAERVSYKLFGIITEVEKIKTILSFLEKIADKLLSRELN